MIKISINFAFTKLIICLRYICLLLGIVSYLTIYSQVYNSYPISHYDFEVNPAILSSFNQARNIHSFNQIGFSDNAQFTSFSVKYSQPFRDSFKGIGIILNHTRFGEKTNYGFGGISFGYRNIILDKILLQIGTTYKLISTYSPPGYFDYFAHKQTNQEYDTRNDDNYNFSLSLSSGGNKFYSSFCLINIQTPWDLTTNKIEFSKYYAINVGNFLSLFNNDYRNEVVSFSSIIKKNNMNNEIEIVNFIHIKLNKPINRGSSMQFGTRAGYSSNNFFHFLPQIAYYRRSYLLNFSVNIFSGYRNIEKLLQTTVNVQLIYNL